ncbi:MAG TPA: DHCW motif cupin fold protein [Stellaceae bacterium]|nr:DHCW motif cupin fold protein [Stellaceae bacterium]
MDFPGLPCGAIDWAREPSETVPGATGTAIARARRFGDIQLRLVDYSAGYLADHWCDKGHILFVTYGALTIEHRDGHRYDLAAGMSWHVADDGAPAHRVVCESGATVFILD